MKSNEEIFFFFSQNVKQERKTVAENEKYSEKEQKKY